MMATWDAEISKLPVEDAVWTLLIEDNCPVEDSDGEESTASMISILDNHGNTVGISYSSSQDDNVSPASHVQQTLTETMLKPWCWKPRRPRAVHIIAENQIPGLSLDSVGVHLVGSSAANHPAMSHDSAQNARLTRMCSVCRRRGDPELFSLCPRCSVVFVCSDVCLRRMTTTALPDTGDPAEICHLADDHHTHCDQLAVFAQDAPALTKDLPFTFTEETTCPEFTEVRLLAFLGKHGVSRNDAWLCGHPSLRKQEQPDSVRPQSDLLPEKICQPHGEKSFKDWGNSYAAYQLDLSSPIAAMLTYPLTLYYILTQLFTPDKQKEEQERKERTMCVHLIGACKEVYLAELFTHLHHILSPDQMYEIVMIGPEVDRSMHGNIIKDERVKVTFHRGLYHKYNSDQKPDVVVGLNAGIGAYRSWKETLQKLKKENIPAYFTDYCRYSSELAGVAMRTMQLGEISEPQINPFRSPLRIFCEEHTLPWYSNAYIFHLIYS